MICLAKYVLPVVSQKICVRCMYHHRITGARGVSTCSAYIFFLQVLFFVYFLTTHPVNKVQFTFQSLLLYFVYVYVCQQIFNSNYYPSRRCPSSARLGRRRLRVVRWDERSFARHLRPRGLAQEPEGIARPGTLICLVVHGGTWHDSSSRHDQNQSTPTPRARHSILIDLRGLWGMW